MCTSKGQRKLDDLIEQARKLSTPGNVDFDSVTTDVLIAEYDERWINYFNYQDGRFVQNGFESQTNMSEKRGFVVTILGFDFESHKLTILTSPLVKSIADLPACSNWGHNRISQQDIPESLTEPFCHPLNEMMQYYA